MSLSQGLSQMWQLLQCLKSEHIHEQLKSMPFQVFVFVGHSLFDMFTDDPIVVEDVWRLIVRMSHMQCGCLLGQ